MPRFLSPYELDEISGVLEDRDQPTPTELQSNFGVTQLFETETIDLDKVSPDLRIGIFVASDQQAKPTTVRGYDTKVFYPGYWKDKSTVDFRNLRKRRAGQPLHGKLSNGGKIRMAVEEHMKLMEDKRIRLLEWISAELLLFGKYTATSDLHPPVTIDMERNIATTEAELNAGTANQADLTVISANGGAGLRAWDSTGGTKAISPINDLNEMLRACWEPIEKIYISDNAWELLVKDPDFDTLISNQVTTLTSFDVDLLPKQQTKEGLKFRGVIGSQRIAIWTYNASYQKTSDPSTALTKFLPDGYVIMVPNATYGVQAYGAIEHAGADFESKEIFWNSWVTEEDGKPWLQGQSAPAFLHTKINSTAAWKVMS